MTSKEKNAVMKMIERFFYGKYNSYRCLGGEWMIAKGGYDLVAEIYHNNIPVAQILNDICRYRIKACNEEGIYNVIGMITMVFRKNRIAYI